MSSNNEQRIIDEIVKLFHQKHKDYGDMRNDLGIQAQYVDIHRKVGKLRKALWDGVELTGEQPREIMLDLIGHLLLTIDMIDRD